MKQFKLRASAAGNMLTAKGAMSKAETPKSYHKRMVHYPNNRKA